MAINKKSEMLKYVKNKYSVPIIDEIPFFAIAKCKIEEIKDQNLLSSIDFSVLASISSFFMRDNSGYLTTMTITNDMIRDRLMLKKNKKNDDMIENSVNNLFNLNIINIKHYDNGIFKVTQKLKIKQSKSDNENNNNQYIFLPRYAFERIIEMKDVSDIARLNLLASYISISYRIFVAKRIKNTDRNSNVDPYSSVINFEDIESIGARIGVSKSTIQRYVKTLIEMRLITEFKIIPDRSLTNYYYLYLTQYHLTPYMQDSMIYKIKRGKIKSIKK